MITTVVTNFQRPDLLRRALISLAVSRTPNVVISSCGVTQAVEEVHDFARRMIPGVVVISRKEDIDSNECWLSGVEACRTDFVHILHDDDVVAPDFASVAAHLNGDIDVVLMDAFFQGDGPEIPSKPLQYSAVLDKPQGRIPPEILGPRLMCRGTFGLSPINGILRKELALEALEESAQAFSGPEWHVRPTMMVGNDLLLWIRTCQRTRGLYYDKRALVGYGLHGGSTTVAHMGMGKGDILTEIYDRVRDYAIKNS